MRRRIEIGLLYSLEGSYALLSQAARSGALRGMAAVNASPTLDLTLVPVARDPKGNIDLYGPLCEEILQETSARHVIGCVTSWSRKEVIPTLERVGGTLWYAIPYEGFEAADCVAYTHACPNQHLVPLLDWILPRYGRRCYLTGSNYIWGWEMSRIARQFVTDAGGEVAGERYLPLGSVEVDRMIAEIRATRPDFVLNSLIGPSSYSFMRAYAELGEEDAHFRPDRCPVLSCNVTECEIPALGQAGEGLIAAGPYFRGATGWPKTGAPFGNSHEAAAYAAVCELAGLLAHRPGAEHLPLSQLLAGADSALDHQTHHTRLPVLIAQIENGAFVVREALPTVAGDPYLSHLNRRSIPPAPHLTVVS